jgi:FlaA1/EpsC-like NDP-sugar epimerase
MRNRHFFFLDVLLLAGLPALAVGLRVESFSWPAELSQAVTIYALLALGTRLVVAYEAGLYRCIWRHASISELQRILYAGAISGILTFLIGTVGLTATGLAPVRLPYAALVLDAMLATGVLAAPRLLARFAGRRTRHGSGHRAIVVGAGAAGQLILRETRNNERLNVHIVAFVDDNPEKQHQLLGGIAVRGTVSDLPELIVRFGADEVIIAMPNARGSVVRRVLQAANDANIPARTLPALDDLISGRIKVSSLRRVEIEDLLRREPISTDRDAVRTLSTGKTVLVTGAGGSIGSELCRQIAELHPDKLVLLDHSENQTFEVHGELRRRFPALRVLPIIADIRDAARLHGILSTHRPFAVFHAAAHKHVPLMEENIVEAITNNVLGTRNLVDACLDAETQHLVNISTDKAVRPTSIMGATKRVAEQIVFHSATTDKKNFVSVRFGNVLGSRGSVIPTFLRQIQDGGPVTVTHPEMRRYFMTIPEAVQLVLQAGALGTGGELFVLDMGDPIRIIDLARDLIRLSGLEEGSDIEIEYTGIRPGEKLFEEVFFGGEDVRATNHPKVLRAIGETIDAQMVDRVEALIRLASSYSTSDGEMKDALRVLVPEFALEDARSAARQRPSPTPPAVAKDAPKPSAAN